MAVADFLRESASNSFLLLAAGAFGLYVIGSTIYNLYFHPLAKYPGPFWCKVSSIPSWAHALTGYRHIWIWKCHQQYGDIFRCTPDALVFNTPNAVRDIYSHKANVQRAPFYESWKRNTKDDNTFNTVDKAAHAQRRRHLSAIFSERSLRSSEEYVAKHAARWCELLMEGGEKDWSEPKNMSTWTNALVFDILGDLCFGQSFEVKEPGENRFRVIPGAIHEYLAFMYPVTQSPLMGLFMWLKPRGLDVLLDKATPPTIRMYYNFLESSVADRSKREAARAEGDESRKDMFHYIFQAKDLETGRQVYDTPALVSEANMFVIAGSDTTSVTFSAAVFYLTRYPRVYAKLVEEVRTTFKSADEIRGGPTLQSCRYLRACIDETLRMTPGAPSELQREVLSGGQTVDGEFIPKGVRLGVSAYSLGYNEDYFADPFVYRPERWIVDEKNGVSEESVARAQEAFIPFSTGAGGCIGKNLAVLELTLVLARLFYLMDIRAQPGAKIGEGSKALGWGRRNPNIYQIQDAYLSLRQGPMVQLKKRAL